MDELQKIKKLREVTFVGIAECKEALHKSGGDFDKALSILRERGARVSEKKAARKTQQGIIDAYVHFSGTMAAMVEVNCETDFVARNELFKEFVRNLSVHVAASAPRYISSEEIPHDVLIKFSPAEKTQFIKEQCLLEQAFVKDNAMTIRQYLQSIIGQIGENIVIRRFARFALGEYEETTQI